jgi:sucrose-6-phosphate hydrolase SacC (GH32 family)
LDRDAAALVVSCNAPEENRPLLHSVAFTGALRDGRFDGELDHGDVFYAAALSCDESGRTLLWGWAQERLHPDRQAMLPHAGALSLPRDVRLHDGRLRTHPIPELQRLRRGPSTGTRTTAQSRSLRNPSSLRRSGAPATEGGD